MSTKNRKKNKRKFITRGHGNEPTVIEFNLSKAVLLCITIGVIITTITTVKVITTIIGASKGNVLAEEEATYTYVQSSDGIQVPVPKGYVASQIPGETSVSGGFVIYEDNYNGQSIDWNSILGTNSLSLNSLEASSQTTDTTNSATNGTSVDETTDNNLNESEEINEEETELDQTTSNETTNNDNKVDETETVDEQKETTGTEGTSETESTDKTEDFEGTEITDNNEGVDDNTDKSDSINDEKITEQEEEQTDKITEGTSEEQEEKQGNNEESKSQEDNNKEELKNEEQIDKEEGDQEQEDTQEEQQQETNQPEKLQSAPNTVLGSENSIQLYANSTQQDINIFNLQKSVNQYVWVPVNDISRIYGADANGKLWGKLYSYYDSDTGETIGRTPVNWTEINGVFTIKDNNIYAGYEPVQFYGYNFDSRSYFDGKTSIESFLEAEKNFYATIKSIKKYGGFYIGRYETGGLSETAVVRKMSEISRISGTGYMHYGTWSVVYEKTKELSGSNENVTTSMIWGSLWDETLQWFIDSGAKTSRGTIITDELLVDSTSWGNYETSVFNYIPADAEKPNATATKAKDDEDIIPTGSAEYTKVNNIYDMAGNSEEFTLESNGTSGLTEFARGQSSYFRETKTYGYGASMRYSARQFREFSGRAILLIK